MVIDTSGVLGRQMAQAGARSEISVLAAERLDSLETLSSPTPGSFADTVLVGGGEFVRSWTVTEFTPVLFRLDVSVAPVSGSGPSHAITSYLSLFW